MDKPMPRYPEAIPLLTLQNRLKDLITAATRLQNQWVVAEFSDVMRKGGHIYADLVQKDECGCTVARLRATLWHGTGMGLFRQYGPRLSEIFMNGAEAKLCGSVSFHPLFGLNFNITDLDPSYRRDTSRLQAEIIAALRREGVIDANKSLDMPVAPQRIAVISAEGAAGYGDFKAQLHNNPYRLKFFPVLFPATMQGAAVSPTVREALEAVRHRLSEFDCVAIIRGGGSTTDLAGFDELQLARAVATFPLPVIVGIGHERDNTVLDFIAHTRVKTPTAAAEWLVANAAGAGTHHRTGTRHSLLRLQQARRRQPTAPIYRGTHSDFGPFGHGPPPLAAGRNHFGAAVKHIKPRYVRFKPTGGSIKSHRHRRRTTHRARKRTPGSHIRRPAARYRHDHTARTRQD